MTAVSTFLGLAFIGCSNPIGDVDATTPYQVGFNMIRTVDGTPFDNSDAVIADIARAGGQGMRQLRAGDLGWFSTHRGGDLADPERYDFSTADEYLLNDHGVYAIPTLFQTGPTVAARSFGESCPREGASESRYCQQPHTPDGDILDLRDDDVAAAVEGYLTAVGEHYADSGLRHFEVLNEPARFHHYDLGVGYRYDWEPERYVELLEQTATTLKAINPDFSVVMGGMVYYDQQKTDGRQEMWEDYLDKVLRLGGGEFIDVVNFHYYGDWAGLPAHIGEVKRLMAAHGIEEKPLWMTEVGSSATVLGEEEQAGDVVRTFAIAFCNGVALGNWHTHISNNDTTEDWGGYGSRRRNGGRHLSWDAFQGFSHRFGQLERCEIISQGQGDAWAYEMTSSGRTALVAWSDDASSLSVSHLIDTEHVQVTAALPDLDGEVVSWRQRTDEPVALGLVPLYIEPATPSR